MGNNAAGNSVARLEPLAQPFNSGFQAEFVRHRRTQFKNQTPGIVIRTF